MSRPGVRGTFSHPGPSHPAAAVRLARTLGLAKNTIRQRPRAPRALVAHGCQVLLARPEGTNRHLTQTRSCHRVRRHDNPVLQARPQSRLRRFSYPKGKLPEYGKAVRWSSMRLAERAAGVWRSPQRRSTAPALPSAETGKHSWRASMTRSSNMVLTRARPNPSLNHRTPNGTLSWPGLRYAVHFLSPGQAILPSVSG